MEILTTLFLIIASLSVSIFLITRGISMSKKSINDLKSGKK